MTMRTAVLAMLLSVAAACGGNVNEVKGSYRGQSIEVADGLMLPPQRDFRGNEVTVVVLESAADACALMQSKVINDTRLITVALAIETPGGLLAAASSPGTYQIGGPPFLTAGTKLAGVRFGVVGACGAGTVADAISGTVEVTRVTPNLNGGVRSLDGSFDAVFDNSERITGTFQVAACEGARLAFGTCR
jgi:hypothetical protein